MSLYNANACGTQQPVQQALTSDVATLCAQHALVERLSILKNGNKVAAVAAPWW